MKNYYPTLITVLAHWLKKKPDYFKNRTPLNFESDVYDIIKESAQNGVFEGSISLISGHKFPDITVKNFYGVEVKAISKNTGWKSVGNSVLESTRIDDIQRIYLFFGRLVDPADFKWRLYQDCLYEIAVTHSPRYLIDMELNSNDTIFTKIGVAYDNLRQSSNPIASIVEYYRKQAKKGEQPWWINNPDEVTPATIRLLENLPQEEKKTLRIQAMTRFPEVFSRKTHKYKQLATWLVARHGLTSTSLRDLFSAGGSVSIKLNGKTYNTLPKVFKHLHDNFTAVLNEITLLSSSETIQYWQRKTSYSTKESLIKLWTTQVIAHAKTNLPASEEFIYHLFCEKLPPIHYPDEVREAKIRYGF